MKILELDNTYRSTFHLCKRKYFLTKELGIIPIKGSTALRYGSTWHGFIEGYYSHIKDNGWSRDGEAIKQAAEYGAAIWQHETEAYGQTFDETDYRTLQNATLSFLEYCTEFQHDYNMLKVIETEQMFDCPMKLAESEKKYFSNLTSLDIHFTGRLDVQIELSGMPWILEAKSTGQPISTQASRLHRSPQIIGYSYAGRHALGFPAEGCMVDLHQLSSKRKQDGEWGKMTRKFQRPPHIFTNEDLEAWRLSFLATCSELVSYQKIDFWPMQFDSCYQFGRCQFCNICEGNVPLEKIRNEIEEGYIPEGFLINKKNFLDFSTKRLIEKLKVERANQAEFTEEENDAPDGYSAF
jgi:hypothetical protein